VVAWFDGGITGGVGFFVCSYDVCAMKWDTLRDYQWDLAIIDECHFAKNPETQRTKLIYGKGGVAWAR